MEEGGEFTDHCQPTHRSQQSPCEQCNRPYLQPRHKRANLDQLDHNGAGTQTTPCHTRLHGAPQPSSPAPSTGHLEDTSSPPTNEVRHAHGRLQRLPTRKTKRTPTPQRGKHCSRHVINPTLYTWLCHSGNLRETKFVQKFPRNLREISGKPPEVFGIWLLDLAIIDPKHVEILRGDTSICLETEHVLQKCTT